MLCTKSSPTAVSFLVEAGIVFWLSYRRSPWGWIAHLHSHVFGVSSIGPNVKTRGHVIGRALRRMPRCASALLMGCSSGSLAKAGQYEPSGPVLAYLMAGTLTHTSKSIIQVYSLGGYLLCRSLYSDMCYGQPLCLMRTATLLCVWHNVLYSIVTFTQDSACRASLQFWSLWQSELSQTMVILPLQAVPWP